LSPSSSLLTCYIHRLQWPHLCEDCCFVLCSGSVGLELVKLSSHRQECCFCLFLIVLFCFFPMKLGSVF
jgi:hypothetical protein